MALRDICMALTIAYLQASSDKKQLDVGANLFIGNLDENVDERLLYDTFSAFGVMATTAKVCPRLRVNVFPYSRIAFRLLVTQVVGSQKVPGLCLTQISSHPTPRLSP